MRVTKEKKAVVVELWIYLNTKAAKNKNTEIFSFIFNPDLFKGDGEEYMDFLCKNRTHAIVCKEYIVAHDKGKFFRSYGINSVTGTHIKRR